MKDGILYARFPPKALAGTMFGEIGGLETERTRDLIKLLEAANLPYKINNEMEAFLITHSISDIAMTGVLVQEDKIIDEKELTSRKTAQKITATLKTYLRAIQKAGVTMTPSFFNVMLKCPSFILNSLFMLWLGSNMVKDMLSPEFAHAANRENVQLERDLLKFLSQNGVTP